MATRTARTKRSNRNHTTAPKGRPTPKRNPNQVNRRQGQQKKNQSKAEATNRIIRVVKPNDMLEQHAYLNIHYWEEVFSKIVDTETLHSFDNFVIEKDLKVRATNPKGQVRQFEVWEDGNINIFTSN